MHSELTHGPDALRYEFNSNWLFGGSIPSPLPPDWPDDAMAATAADPRLDDSAFEPITLPHTAVPLSWNQWDPTTWDEVWTYRKHFDLPADAAGRIFVDFEAANVSATVTLNGTRIGRHFGGYLPFSFEITDAVQATDNVLAVLVDSRFNLNVPPNIPAPVHSEAVDYGQPGGIHGSVTLRVQPVAFIADVAATPRDVLDPASRRVELVCTIDSSAALRGVQIESVLEAADGTSVATALAHSAELPSGSLDAGKSEVALTIDGLADIDLWDVDSPVLYRVVTTLTLEDGSTHIYRTRIGFREARFEVDGFYLNGVASTCSAPIVTSTIRTPALRCRPGCSARTRSCFAMSSTA